MSQNKYLTMPLYQLHKLCQIGDHNALSEWKKRWEDDYPKIREIKKCQAQQRPAKIDSNTLIIP
jgi:hypothetical protein